MYKGVKLQWDFNVIRRIMTWIVKCTESQYQWQEWSMEYVVFLKNVKLLSRDRLNNLGKVLAFQVYLFMGVQAGPHSTISLSLVKK